MERNTVSYVLVSLTLTPTPPQIWKLCLIIVAIWLGTTGKLIDCANQAERQNGVYLIGKRVKRWEIELTSPPLES